VLTTEIQSEGMHVPSKTTESRSFVDIVRNIRRWVVVHGTADSVSDARRLPFAFRRIAGKWHNASERK
jgi:hypothetical protein